MGKSVFGKNSVSLQSRSTCTLTGVGAVVFGFGALAFTAFFGAGAFPGFATFLGAAFSSPASFLGFAAFFGLVAPLALPRLPGSLLLGKRLGFRGLGFRGLGFSGGFALGCRVLLGCSLCRGFGLFGHSFLGGSLFGRRLTLRHGLGLRGLLSRERRLGLRRLLALRRLGLGLGLARSLGGRFAALRLFHHDPCFRPGPRLAPARRSSNRPCHNPVLGQRVHSRA